MNRFYFTIIIASLLLLPARSFSQVKNYREEGLLMKKTMLQYHVEPRKIDDKFSELVYENFLQELDPDGLFFTEEDVKSLRPYRLKLDDEFNGIAWTFLPHITQVYKKCLQRAVTISDQLFQTPFTFTVNEFFTRDTSYAKNEADLKNRWRLKLRYAVISRLQEMNRIAAESDDTKFLQTYESAARQRAKAGIKRSIRRFLDHATGFENYVSSVYLGTVAHVFDPHSTYLSPTEMENFLASLSSEGYYFGLMLGENVKGDIVIEQLTPGGPAWKSGVLNSGDIIRQVKWDGKEAMDLYGVDLDEFNDILLEVNHSSMELTVIKPGGVPATVVLRKEKMEAEENIVKSFILQGKRKVGYISLPGFYSNWGEKEGTRCANDVAKEIIKLKKENIEGLILDLRFNGGGSIMEAVSMAGIFIDAGPIGIMKNKAGENVTLKDINRGTIYDGPLVLVVNGMSASASEFLTAALQDYQRAIVVGSRTYGKATAQNLFPLDTRAPASVPVTQVKPGIGYASITIEKIYRITGKTAQLNGVRPHIILPDIYDSLEFREAVMPMALPYDSISKKTYYQPLVLLPVAELKHKSELRVAKHPGFGTIRETSKIFQEIHNVTRVSLLWSDYKKQTSEWLHTLEQVKKGSQDSTAFGVEHHNFERQRMQMDAYIQDFNAVWIKKLKQDISLEEAFHIICDYIDINLRKVK